jgi:hypothetical protein
MNEYYTYAYLRENRTPYYIGKGKKRRIYRKDRRIKPPKDKSRIIFLKQNLTEEEAFKHEIYMISVFGRKDLGTGILHNRTNGGEGTSGSPRFISEEHKEKIRNIAKGRVVGEETRKKLSEIHKNRKFSEESRKKMSDSKKNVKKTEEHKINISKSHKNRDNETYRKYVYTFISPSGEITITTEVSDFCSQHNLTYSKVNYVSRGIYSQHKGWKIIRKLKNVSE